MAGNILDKLIAAVAPSTGLKRIRDRERLRAYEGASPRDGWRPRRAGASANTDHTGDATTLRVRARSLVQNVPYVARGLESLVANIVGTGITPRSLSSRASEIDAIWAEWARVADADGRLDIYGIQAAAYRAMEQDGEVLIRLRTRRAEDGLPVPLQLQVLEIDWLDSSKTGTREGAPGGTIVNGIEYDALGKVTAYWLFDQHPGELVTGRRQRSASYPVPASSIIHLFNPARPGQGRGFTRLAPVIARVRDLQLYEDAELQRKNLETRLAVLASTDPKDLAFDPSPDAATVQTSGELGTLSSGSITQVPPGMNLTVVEPKAAPGYVDYLRFNLHLVAAGMGVTYEMLTGDVKEVNFSSARVAMLEFRRGAEQTQWLTLIPRLCVPIWRAFIDAAVLAGKLRQADYRADWSTPKWDYVNPEQDVKADLAEISGGLSTISEKLRRRGYKPELVFAELRTDFERLRSDGTLDLLLQLQTGQPAASADPASTPQGTAREAIGGLTRIAEAALVQRQADATHAPAREPQRIDVRVEQPASQVTVHAPITLQPQAVEVRNEITTPEPQVHIEAVMPEARAQAPAVTVINQVEPAAVTVVDSHPTRSVQTVERDENDEITRTVTTFER
jgi:lambda family phage portal protein